MTNPITPPPELVEQWNQEAVGTHFKPFGYAEFIAAKAAQWGADQELKACCEHMRDHQWGFVERPDGAKIHRAVYLQQSRRPKPPSLKEQALAVLDDCSDRLEGAHENTIRRALEALDD